MAMKEMSAWIIWEGVPGTHGGEEQSSVNLGVGQQPPVSEWVREWTWNEIKELNAANSETNTENAFSVFRFLYWGTIDGIDLV